ncbi:CHASE domain-containing protein [Tahibacter amnicola]|uniref:histidine kinase n=1 Tax=Tahibacter amnicola TaxID=2976241 RepID=A0ABY6BDX2_9GAMM|nr:CHASE domain-containing protein [Tahibacter amnicola]UXI66821.1 CHASE domain-containing protein [Tahibacter amnicola]
MSAQDAAVPLSGRETATRLAQVLAVVVVGLAILGLLAALSIKDGLVPSPPASFCLALVGASLFLQARGGRRAAWLSVPVLAAALIVAGLTLSGQSDVLRRGLPWLARLPVNAAIGLAGTATALCLTAHPSRRARVQLLIMLCAGVALALGLSGLFGRLMGIAPDVGWSLRTNVSFASSVGLMAAGLGIMALVNARVERRDHDVSGHVGGIAAAAVFAISLGATLLVWQASVSTHLSRQRQAFEFAADQMADTIRDRLLSYLDILHGVQGLFAASERVEPDEWRRFIERLDLGVRYPGAASVGFAPRVPAAALGSYLKAQQAINPAFRVWPAGERPEYYPLTFVEPIGVQQQSLGYDLSVDPVRDAAIAHAMGRDEAALTGKLDIPTVGGNEPGFAVFVALRGGGRDEDLRAMEGVAYLAARGSDWMKWIQDDARDLLHVQIFDGDAVDPARLLAADTLLVGDLQGSALSTTRRLTFGNHPWTVSMQATPAFMLANQTSGPLWVLSAGLACSLMLFLIAWLLAGARSRALSIAERMTTEFRRSQHAFQAVADTANDAIVTAGADGRIRYINPAAERCFGWPAADLQGRELTVLMPARDHEAHLHGMARYLATGKPVVIGRTIERHGIRRNGEEFPIEISIASWESDDGMYFTAIVRDITERRRAQQALELHRVELQRSNADLEQFAYVASHDLQEPLRMVASYVQLLSRRYSGKLDQDADDFIRFAVDGATRMQQLIDDLLTYSRITSRGDPARITSSAACVDAALRNLSARMLETKASVHIGFLPEVKADPGQMTQLFQNLVGNALKFHGNQPPTVNIDAERDGDCWRFCVRDQGIGIDPQYAERIFVIFQRLHSRQEYPGTGIGLALCKKIVERAGGRIWVESQLGQGARFCFTLPVVEEKSA